MTEQDALIPFLGEIFVERVISAGYSASPPTLVLEIVQVEKHDTQGRLEIQFSEQAVFSILSAVEDILSHKSGDTPSTPKSIQ